MVNGTLLNFGKRNDNNFRVIFDQWLKLHLSLDALSNQKILKDIYSTYYVVQLSTTQQNHLTVLLLSMYLCSYCSSSLHTHGFSTLLHNTYFIVLKRASV